MLLSGPEIERRRGLGQIVIEPWDAANLNPNSYNLTLSDQLLVYDLDPTHPSNPRMPWLGRQPRYKPDDELVMGTRLSYSTALLNESFAPGQPPEARGGEFVLPLDAAKVSLTFEFKIPPQGLILYPGVLYLGSTVERTITQGLVPCIEGRSSLGRLGLGSHVTAGFGDDGFDGHWTLELTVVHPLRIYAGMKICQIAYTELTGERSPYKGKYQGQRGPRPSGLWKELQTEKQKKEEAGAS